MDIDRANVRARIRAQKANSATYQHWVADTWPACTLCGIPIRQRGDEDLTCGCEGVRWEWTYPDRHYWISELTRFEPKTVANTQVEE